MDRQREAPIEVVAYDPAWPTMFEAERDHLALVLASWLGGPIEHIGSTAIAGLAAKPVIDIMAAVQSLEASRDAIPALEIAGYCYSPYKADVMHWFCKPTPRVRTHHLHLVPFEGDLWFERLAFRDYLRTRAVARSEYEALKRDLARRFRDDREAYTEAKAGFVDRMTACALAERTR